MRKCNRWVGDYLANADEAYFREIERSPGRVWDWLKHAVEFLFGGRLGDQLEAWEYQRKLRRFAADLQTPHNAALLDDQHVKGHFNDHGHPVMQHYEDRLRKYNLEALPLGGD